MPIAVIAAALVAVIVWGASPVASKIAVAELPPPAVALLRTVLGGLAALPLALLLRIPFPSGWRQRAVLLLSAFGGFIAFPMLFTAGIARTSANHASMILASLPIFTGAIAMAWDRRRPGRRWWLGCAVALGGAAVLIGGRQAAGAGEAGLLGDLLVLAANGFAASGYVAGGRLQREGYPSTGTTFWGAAVAAALLLPAAPFVLAGIAPDSIGVSAWAGVAYLALGVTVLGYVAWYWALGHGGIARVGLFQFLQPVSGLLLAGLLLGEALSLSLLLAAAMILAGVWLAMRDRGA
ncbi:MAG: DMT family transporter [Geminicoccaceae bacterium]